MEARGQRLNGAVRPLAVLLALCMGGSQALAHDSWLSPSRAPSSPGRVGLELATGNRYPVQEFSPQPASVAQAHCSDGTGRRLPLRAGRAQPQWLDLRVRFGASRAPPLSCWLELRAAEIEIEPRLVEVYLDEIRASPANRQAWAQLREHQVPWRESYRKFARIELAEAFTVTADRRLSARQPSGMAMEMLVLGDQPIAAGRPLTFQVLMDGQPLAGFPVELVSERSKLGIWRETDAQGMLRHSLPFAGRWLLRGTQLRPSASRPDTWESRFVTLAIEAR